MNEQINEREVMYAVGLWFQVTVLVPFGLEQHISRQLEFVISGSLAVLLG